MPLLSLLVILLLLRRLLVLRVRIRIIVICATNTSTGHHRRHHYYLHYLQLYRCRRCKQHLYLKLRLRKGRQLWHNARLSQEEVLNLHGSQRLLRLTSLNSRACRSQYGIMPTDILKRVHFRLFCAPGDRRRHQCEVILVSQAWLQTKRQPIGSTIDGRRQRI